MTCTVPVPRHRPGTPAGMLSRRAHGAHADAGFTLIEAIVSLTLFVIVAAAAVLALVTGVKGNNDTADRVTAAQLAQQETDRARAMSKASLTAAPSVSAQQTVGGKTFTVTRTVSYPDQRCLAATATVAPGDESVRKIAVSVTVTPPGAAGRVVRMDSVIAC